MTKYVRKPLQVIEEMINAELLTDDEKNFYGTPHIGKCAICNKKKKVWSVMGGREWRCAKCDGG